MTDTNGLAPPPHGGLAHPLNTGLAHPLNTGLAGPLSSALLTDHYEFTMVDAAVTAGVADRACVFELFTRRLPEGRRYGVVAGVDRALDLVKAFQFDEDLLAHLVEREVIRTATAEWLAATTFNGTIDAFADGEVYLPDEPVVTVRAPFGQAVLLETLLLSVLNHDAAIAAAAARMIDAAGGRNLLEFGSRRTHEQAAVAAGAVAVRMGFDGTSNLAAGARFGVPTLGTSAHAFTLLFDDELTAFEAQVAALGPETTLLVDTYDISTGIERAVKAAGTGLGAIRIDSGDLHAEATAARQQLDALGATGTRIVVSSDLDEFALADLADAPIDGYGVGTRLVTGSGHPTAEFVYKLVARQLEDGPMEGVAKDSASKATRAGRKTAWRVLDDGRAVKDVVVRGDGPVDDARPLATTRVREGIHVAADGPSPTDRLAASLAELSDQARRLDPGPPALPVTFET